MKNDVIDRGQREGFGILSLVFACKALVTPIERTHVAIVAVMTEHYRVFTVQIWLVKVISILCTEQISGKLLLGSATIDIGC